MLALELGHQRRHREEVVAADIQHELRVGEIAMEVGEIIDLGNRELEAALQGVVVPAVLPRWEHCLVVAWRLGLAVPGRIGTGRPRGLGLRDGAGKDRRDGGGEQHAVHCPEHGAPHLM